MQTRRVSGEQTLRTVPVRICDQAGIEWPRVFSKASGEFGTIVGLLVDDGRGEVRGLCVDFEASSEAGRSRQVIPVTSVRSISGAVVAVVD